MSARTRLFDGCGFCGVLLAASAMSMQASGGVFSDEFGVAHDYAGAGVAGTGWDGFFYNFANGNAAVYAADADTSNAGRLTFRSVLGNWENGDDDGILLYRTVAGDFDAVLQVTSMNNVEWHDAGLMARVPDLDAAGPGEDWVAVKYFPNQNRNGHRSTDNGVSATVVPAVAVQPWLRLRRLGDTFTSYRSADGAAWTQLSSSTRTDMTAVAVQVGIWQATFSGNQGLAQFDHFSLRSLNLWALSTGGSWTNAAAWTQGAPAGVAEWAMLGGALASSGSVTLDGTQTVGRLSFNHTASYSVNPGAQATASVLIVDDGTGLSGDAASIEVLKGSHTITVPVALSNGVTVSTAAGAGLTLTKGLSGAGALTKSGNGALSLASANRYSGPTLVQGGLVRLLPLPDGTQAFYSFDNATSLGQDSSVMGNDLTAVGAPEYASAGRFGGAVYLNGSAYFTRSVFPSGVPTGSSAYTIALWAKDNGSAISGGFAGWGNNSGGQCNNFRYSGNNALNNYWWGNDWVLGSLSANPKDGQWHHLAVTWNGLTQTMYVDGSPVGSASRTGLNAQPANFFVGKTTGDQPLKGWMDNLLIANRALSAAEIAGLATDDRLDDLLPVGAPLTVDTGALLELGGSSQTLAGLSGGGRVMNGTSVPATLTVGSDNVDRTFSGTIDGPVELVKVGSGKLTLSGVNAYGGGSTVNSGTLAISVPSLQALLAGSLAWFDASDAATVTTNAVGQVTLWSNKGSAGAALNAVQINAGVGPTVLANALNGRPVLSVDGTTALRTQGNLGIAGSADRSIFAVASRKNNGTNFIAHVGLGSNGRAFGLASQTEMMFAYTWGNDITFAARPNGTYEIYDMVIASAAATANVLSGGTVLSGSKTIAPNTADSALYLGSRFDATCWGNLAEVIVFNRAVTPVERTGIEAYLRAKWLGGDVASAFSAGAVSLAGTATLDLCGTAQTLSALSGVGRVTNGTLAVSGIIAPGGTNAVGTLTFDSVMPQSGTLLVDVRENGSCDRLNVSGALDLSGLSLRVQDASQLKSKERYIVAACAPGALTGSFATTDLGSKGWYVSASVDRGEVLLLSRGLVFMVK